MSWVSFAEDIAEAQQKRVHQDPELLQRIDRLAQNRGEEGYSRADEFVSAAQRIGETMKPGNKADTGKQAVRTRVNWYVVNTTFLQMFGIQASRFAPEK